MLNFNQFINESKDNEFDRINVGDTVRVAGFRKKVTKVGYGIIHLGSMKINKGQWIEKHGALIEKADDKDEK